MQAGDRHGAAAAWSTLERVGATLSRVHAQVALLGSNSTGLPHALEAQQTAALSRLWLGENERRVMWPCAESSAWAAPRHAASLLLRTEPGLSSSATKQREAPADAVETHFELASDDVCPPPQKVLDELLRSLPAAERPRVSSAMPRSSSSCFACASAAFLVSAAASADAGARPLSAVNSRKIPRTRSMPLAVPSRRMGDKVVKCSSTSTLPSAPPLDIEPAQRVSTGGDNFVLLSRSAPERIRKHSSVTFADWSVAT